MPLLTGCAKQVSTIVTCPPLGNRTREEQDLGFEAIQYYPWWLRPFVGSRSDSVYSLGSLGLFWG